MMGERNVTGGQAGARSVRGGTPWRGAVALLVVLSLLAAGCSGNDEPPPSLSEQVDDAGNDDAGNDDAEDGGDALEATVEFEDRGMAGNHHLTLEPDGTARARIDMRDWYSFALDAEEMDEVSAAVEAAELDEHPDATESEDDDDTLYLFGYGDAELEVYFRHASDEVRELGQLLQDIVRDHRPDDY